jgi:hypothetical protein
MISLGAQVVVLGQPQIKLVIVGVSPFPCRRLHEGRLQILFQRKRELVVDEHFLPFRRTHQLQGFSRVNHLGDHPQRDNRRAYLRRWL